MTEPEETYVEVTETGVDDPTLMERVEGLEAAGFDVMELGGLAEDGKPALALLHDGVIYCWVARGEGVTEQEWLRALIAWYDHCQEVNVGAPAWATKH